MEAQEEEDGDEGADQHQMSGVVQTSVPQSQQPKAVQPAEVGEEHARVYVKKIKTRFAAQPHIYKTFLEILHTFHREKHTIQDVYSQVAMLFKDHADLLAEFAHFLPDPSAQSPQAQAYPSHQDDHGHQGGAHVGKSQRGRGGRAPMEAPTRGARGQVHSVNATAANQAMQAASHSMGSRGLGNQAALSQRGGAIQTPHVGGTASPAIHSAADAANKERSHGTFEELFHFFKIKQILPQNDYEEFLKLLSMYNADVLSKTELYLMVRDLFRHQDLDLLDWFRKFVQVEDLKDEEPQGYLADYDWSASEKLGPSYRSMPRPWSNWKCSGRQGNAICQEVLNDAWISVPTGSEDGAFKNSRKNQYEELLFKCEDDRFELDLLVEGNSSALKALEILYSSIKTLSPSALATFQLNENDVDALTLKAIRRIYANRADEFIKLLMVKPSFALPVLIERLRAKDTEWNLVRREWNVLWKQVFKKNYHKSLDHRSTTFKQEEKKMLTPKSLFAELKKASQEKNAPSPNPQQEKPATKMETDESMPTDQPQQQQQQQQPQQQQNPTETEAATTAAAANGKPSTQPQQSSSSPTLSYIVQPKHLFADIKTLLITTFKSQLPKADLDKFESLWEGVIASFFHVDKSIKSEVPAVEVPSQTASPTKQPQEKNESQMEVDQAPVNRNAAEPQIKTEEPQSAETAAPVTSPSNKPISTVLASEPTSNHMLFLGNDTFYLLFRYLQILYDRLHEAYKFSEEAPPIRHTPIVDIDIETRRENEVNQSLSHLDKDKNKPAESSTEAPATSSNPSESTNQEPELQVYKENPQIITRYRHFLRNLQLLLTNSIDLSAFEEESRFLFGVSCFPLFTIDRLLYLLAKQIHAVSTDETSEKLAGLYHYEVSRNLAGFTDAVYLSNCREVLANDKRAYVFTYDYRNESQIFGITEVDLGHPSFGLEHNEELSRYINNFANTEVQAIAKHVIKSEPLPNDNASSPVANGNEMDTSGGALPASDPNPQTSIPFLKRNLPEDTDSEPGNTITQNELGVKVLPGSYKLRFVGGTEDFLQRSGRNTSHEQSNDKIELSALSENATLPNPLEAPAQE